jgi:hypothetical protein
MLASTIVNTLQRFAEEVMSRGDFTAVRCLFSSGLHRNPAVLALPGAAGGVLLVLAFPLGLARLAATVASTASLPQLVEPAHLVSANARLQVSNALGFVCGPTLAGLLIGVFGSALVPLTLNALSYVVSVLSLLLIRLRPVGSAAAHTSALVVNLARGSAVFLAASPPVVDRPPTDR